MKRIFRHGMRDYLEEWSMGLGAGGHAFHPERGLFSANDSLESPPARISPIRSFIDLFCGIGGFHVAARNLNLECVFASDIDREARRAYAHNHKLAPQGDICAISAGDIPDHDLLCAGFPCQPFSIIGRRKGFSDPRGTLFFEIARILAEKKPKAFILENVRRLASAENGETLKNILMVLRNLGYSVDCRILNALHFGLSQKRERILIVGFLDRSTKFTWPQGRVEPKGLNEVLEKDPDMKYFVSPAIRTRRHRAHESKFRPAIWHENKSGNISSHPYSCALRAGASYNYLLVDGERRLTPREMLRLQGFPEDFEIVCSDAQTRRQAGNSVPVPMIEAVMKEVVNVVR